MFPAILHPLSAYKSAAIIFAVTTVFLKKRRSVHKSSPACGQSEKERRGIDRHFLFSCHLWAFISLFVLLKWRLCCACRSGCRQRASRVQTLNRGEWAKTLYQPPTSQFHNIWSTSGKKIIPLNTILATYRHRVSLCYVFWAAIVSQEFKSLILVTTAPTSIGILVRKNNILGSRVENISVCTKTWVRKALLGNVVIPSRWRMPIQE